MQSKAVVSRTDGRVHFLCLYKENEPKEIRPLQLAQMGGVSQKINIKIKIKIKGYSLILILMFHPHLTKPRKERYWRSFLRGLSERIALPFVSSAAAVNIALTRAFACFFMRTWLTGRHSFAYFSVAVDRKVSCCRSTTDAFAFNIDIKFQFF
ncbi:MAG: hypothetical protein OEY11_13925 [Gammaproteobacteria bacterium]|nr:hypothetical protein [Gammaproteobacteria bacterium]